MHLFQAQNHRPEGDVVPAPTQYLEGYACSELNPFEWHLASQGKRDTLQVLIFDVHRKGLGGDWFVCTCFLDGPWEGEYYYTTNGVDVKRDWPKYWLWWPLGVPNVQV